jgi:hypothetical protein
MVQRGKVWLVEAGAEQRDARALTRMFYESAPELEALAKRVESGEIKTPEEYKEALRETLAPKPSTRE